MNVQIVLFARARELAGVGSVALALSEDATIRDLKAELVHRFPPLQSLMSHCLLSVDQEYATDETRLHPDCEVGLIPPVSGG